MIKLRREMVHQTVWVALMFDVSYLGQRVIEKAGEVNNNVIHREIYIDPPYTGII